jgi:ABC-type nitrate/sulfonate/bicarbonate transport system substrate-binding protein
VKLTQITGIGAMNAVLSKSVEFSISSTPTIIRANARGQKVMSIGQAFEGLSVEVVMRGEAAQAAGITEASPVEKRAQALKGKKVGMLALNTIVHGYLRYFVKKGGVDAERDFQISLMSDEAAIAALKTGAIDAMAQVLPYSTIAVHNGTSMMLSSGYRNDFPEMLPFALNGITALPETCDKTPAICEKIVEGYGKAMRYIHEHTKEAAEIMKKKIPNMEPATFNDAFASIVKWTPKTMRTDEKGLANAQELMIIGGMIKPEEKLASFQGLYTNRFVKD